MMSFIDLYKRLERICNDMYGDKHGISTYIDEMTNNPSGSRYVRGWDEDLKQLKHCRWIRNKIVHEPGYTEENMCAPDDIQWLNDFYSRIMTANDPLALYHKAKNLQNPSYPQQRLSTQQRNYTYTQHTNTPQRASGCFTCLIGVFLVVAVIILITTIT